MTEHSTRRLGNTITVDKCGRVLFFFLKSSDLVCSDISGWYCWQNWWALSWQKWWGWQKRLIWIDKTGELWQKWLRWQMWGLQTPLGFTQWLICTRPSRKPSCWPWLHIGNVGLHVDNHVHQHIDNYIIFYHIVCHSYTLLAGYPASLRPLPPCLPLCLPPLPFSLTACLLASLPSAPPYIHPLITRLRPEYSCNRSG